MKFGNDSSVTVENNGENQGMIAGANYGSMTQNQYGLGYSDTKALCLDIVRDELSKYRAEALIEAQRRNEELFESIVRKLDDRQMGDAQALAEFRNPAMQFDYFEAQKAYMKAGAPELAEMLSNILVERISESSRSLLQIALGEAIQVAPKLIPSQMATLALTFVVGYTRDLSVDSHKSFSEYLKTNVLLLFERGISQKASEFQHLSFTGCSQQSAFERSLIGLLKGAYQGLFMKGFDKEKIPKAKCGQSLFDLYPLFIPCLNDKSKFQINTMTEEILFEQIQKMSIPLEDATALTTLFKGDILPDNEAQALVEKLVPQMRGVFEYWDKGEIKHCFLSSVGIIIGAEYAHQITNENYDLKIWI